MFMDMVDTWHSLLLCNQTHVEFINTITTAQQPTTNHDELILYSSSTIQCQRGSSSEQATLTKPPMTRERRSARTDSRRWVLPAGPRKPPTWPCPTTVLHPAPPTSSLLTHGGHHPLPARGGQWPQSVQRDEPLRRAPSEAQRWNHMPSAQCGPAGGRLAE